MKRLSGLKKFLSKRNRYRNKVFFVPKFMGVFPGGQDDRRSLKKSDEMKNPREPVRSKMHGLQNGAFG